MTDAQRQRLEPYVRSVAPVLRDYVATSVAPLVDRIKALQVQVQALEARPAVVYRGVWRSGEQYAEAAIVTDNGSLWIAKEASSGIRPGSNSSWQLIVKKGGA